MSIVKIIIADDHQIFVDGLTRVLQSQNAVSCEVVATAENGNKLMEVLKENHNANLLLLDLNMPEKDGLEVIDDIRRSYPTLRILVLTMYDEIKIVKSAFNSGVDGYVLKTFGLPALQTAIIEVMEGKRHLGKTSYPGAGL